MRWRRLALAALDLPPGGRLLDVAAGTADLALMAARRRRDIRTAAVDFSSQMLARASSKLHKQSLGDRVHLIQGDAFKLPFASETFHAAAMAFGLRNMDDRLAALKETARVVKSGGIVVILEMTLPLGPIGHFYRFYLNRILPRMAGLISGNREAYAYLSRSIASFPAPMALADLLKAAGLTRVSFHSISGGITYLHKGYKA